MIRRLALLFLWYQCSPLWTMTGNRNHKNVFVYGKPYMILSSTRAKCFSIIAPHDQVISVTYDAPDLVKPPEDMQEETETARERMLQEGERPESNGLDSQWNQRMKERLDRIKSKKFRDTSITITSKGDPLTTLNSATQNTSYDADGTIVTTGIGRVRDELTQNQGRIEFTTGRGMGAVDLCVQSILASSKKPARVHIRVDMAASEDDYDDYDDDGAYLGPEEIEERKLAKAKKATDPDHLEHKEIATKMTRLERDLQTLQNRAKACVNNADYNKDVEAKFHEQSISMHRASTYWPMIQLTVLLITGFTQANHIVRYLKSHHIGM
mmetsp:Transcript_19008/g.39052  ORF Transcript_19008/g.39052 Transcript_19008/m.39052 type:complete len:325 (-) Transcript_19008:252-1226(-)